MGQPKFPLPENDPAGQSGRTRGRLDSVRDFASTTPGARLTLFVLVSVLSGVLLAGLLLPAVGTFGLIAKAGAQTFDEMPSDLATPPLDEKSELLANDGTVLATYYVTNRRVIPLSEMAEIMRKAQVAIEDSRFYDHGGIDLKGTARAFVSTQSGDEVQGGSTLTQQYVKNVLVESALARGDDEGAKAAKVRTRGAEGYARKLRELRYASTIEQRLTKDQILERYLNISYYGNGAYGIESAAQRYFSKPAKDLQLHEAAMLAGFVKNPSEYDPFKRPAIARDRRDIVLNRMAETGAITVDQAVAAKKLPLGLKRSPEQSGCEAAKWGHFCDYIRRLLSDNPVFGQTPEDRRDLLFRGGLTIKSTLDPRMQAGADAALQKRIFPSDPVVGTMVTVEPGTGYIKAMAVNRKFGGGKYEEKLNYAGDMATGGTQGISPGSTFKIFAAAVAIEQGYGLQHRISSPYRISIPSVKRCPGFGPIEGYRPIEGYNPRNERTDESGTYDMRKAFAQSINTYFLQLQSQVEGNICPIAKLVDKLGLKAAETGLPLDQRSDFSIGRVEVSPTAMTAAYATFAARGRYCPPTAVVEVLDRNGKPLPLPDSSCKQVLSQGVADAVNEMALTSTRPGGTGVRAKLEDGREQAGKTGTNERQTVWYIGYTPNLTTSVAVYKPHPKGPNDRQLSGFSIGGVSPENGNWGGYNLPAPLWKLGMDEITKYVPPTKFVPMDPKFEYGTKDRPAPRATTGENNGGANSGGEPGDGATTAAPRRVELGDGEGATPSAPATTDRGRGNGDGDGQ